MKRDISRLVNKEYDLIVVGGGIFGICAAWDATLRGLSVALVEQGDFGHATSANHFKLVHSGIRYLQHGDISRVRESSRERSIYFRIAPHLVHPLPFVIPTYGHGMKSKEVLATAFLIYDLLTLDRNRGIADPDRHVPRCRIISREEALEMFPSIEQERLTGAGIFHEGQIYNPPRLSLAFVKSAVQLGAVAANYVQATGFVRDRDRILGIRAIDQLSGNELELRGKVVINATGPWAKWLLEEGIDLELKPSPTFSRDAYFLVGRRLVKDHALGVQGQTKDPDAILSRGNRHLFLNPWRKYTLVGVWHKVHLSGPEDFAVTRRELQGFIRELNASYPGFDVTLDDISICNAGLTLFGENSPSAKDLSYGKRSLVVDHAKTDGLEGLVTLLGVRFTVARSIAEKAIELIYQKLGKKAPLSQTSGTRLHGGDFDSFQGLVDQVVAMNPYGLTPDTITALLHNHGTDYRSIFRYLDEEPSWAATIGSSTVLEAEVIHAVREEMALKLSDVVLRRTDLGSGEYPSEPSLQTCAEIMASELGWSRSRLQRELSEVREAYPDFVRDSAPPEDNLMAKEIGL